MPRFHSPVRHILVAFIFECLQHPLPGAALVTHPRLTNITCRLCVRTKHLFTVPVTNLRHLTHKASVKSIHAEANAHSADWLMCIFENELALPHVRHQQGKCMQQCRRISPNTVVHLMVFIKSVRFLSTQIVNSVFPQIKWQNDKCIYRNF